MKKAIAVLTIIVISIVFFTGITKGEEVKKVEMETRIIDVTDYVLSERYTCNPIDFASEYDFINLEITRIVLPERDDDGEDEIIITSIHENIYPESWDDVTGASIVGREGKIIATNTPKILDAVEDYIESTFSPRKGGYNMQFSIFRKQGYDLNLLEGSPSGSATEISSKLMGSGFEKTFSSSVFVKTHAYTNFEQIETRTYVRDYEGLIASAAASLDPVISTLDLGNRFSAYTIETGEGIKLILGQCSKQLKRIDTVNFKSGYPIEKPVVSTLKWQRTFNFTKPSTQTAVYYANGFHEVLLIELLED